MTLYRNNSKGIGAGCFLTVFLLLSCSSTVEEVSGGEELEGWRITEEGLDIYYMKYGGRASPNAIEKNDPIMMKTTCVESTRLQARDQIIRKMLGETIEASSGVLDGETIGVVVTSVRKGMVRGTQMKECASVNGDTWLNCECVHYVEGKGLKKKFEFEVTRIVEGGAEIE